MSTACISQLNKVPFIAQAKNRRMNRAWQQTLYSSTAANYIKINQPQKNNNEESSNYRCAL